MRAVSDRLHYHPRSVGMSPRLMKAELVAARRLDGAEAATAALSEEAERLGALGLRVLARSPGTITLASPEGDHNVQVSVYPCTLSARGAP